MIPARPACSIRRATTADAGGILNCLHAAFEPYRDRYTPDAFSDTVLTPVTIQLRLAAMAVFVAVTPAGEIFIWELAVAGEQGVREVLLNLIADADLALGLSGYTSFSQLMPSALARTE